MPKGFPGQGKSKEAGTSAVKATGNNAFDLIITGGGSAAFAAAIHANELGLSTLMVNGGLPIGVLALMWVACLPNFSSVQMKVFSGQAIPERKYIL